VEDRRRGWKHSMHGGRRPLKNYSQISLGIGQRGILKDNSWLKFILEKHYVLSAGGGRNSVRIVLCLPLIFHPQILPKILLLLRNGVSIRILEFLLYILVIPCVLHITIYLKPLSVSQTMQPELYRIFLAETGMTVNRSYFLCTHWSWSDRTECKPMKLRLKSVLNFLLLLSAQYQHSHFVTFGVGSVCKQ
jgi:hypothetical protein